MKVALQRGWQNVMALDCGASLRGEGSKKQIRIKKKQIGIKKNKIQKT